MLENHKHNRNHNKKNRRPEDNFTMVTLPRKKPKTQTKKVNAKIYKNAKTMHEMKLS